MIGTAELVVARARSVVGAPFRPQGRDPQSGLDCVGLALWAFEIDPDSVRRDYRLSGSHFEEVQRELVQLFAPASFEGTPGDLSLCRVSNRQVHLAICCGQSFVHADARLRRVIETPGRPPWPIAAAFRLVQTPTQD